MRISSIAPGRRVAWIPAASGLAAAVWLGIQPPGTARQASGTVLNYDMESRTPDGRLRDLSGHDHHGTFSRAAPIPGPDGKAMLFRTVADRVHIPEHPDFDLDGPFTVAVRVRVDSLGLHQHILACDDKLAVWVTPDNRFRLGDTHGGGASTAPGTAVRGQWTSVVAILRGTRGDSLDQGRVAIYLDGVAGGATPHLRTPDAKAVGRWSPGPLHRTDACYLGFESHQGDAHHQAMPFVGAIDEVIIASRAWTEEEVARFSRAAPRRPGKG